MPENPAGELALCLLLAVYYRNPSLLLEVLAELGDCCTVPEAKKALAICKIDLSEQERSWLEGQMLKIHTHSTLPYTAVLLQRKRADNEKLGNPFGVRLRESELSQIRSLANSTGKSLNLYVREVLKQHIQNTKAKEPSDRQSK